MNNILELLSEEEIKLGRLVKVEKGETLFHEEDLCVYLAIVKSGLISISSFSYEGKEIVFNTIKENQMFGNNLLFSLSPYYKGDVVAQVNSEVLLFNKTNTLKLLQSNKEFLSHYLETQSESEIALHSQIKVLSFDSAKERFLYYLFINNDQIKYQSITDLAKKVHLSREALSRLITELKNKRIIKVTDKKEIIKL